MKPGWIISFSFFNFFFLEALMVWTELRNLPLCFFGNFHMLLVSSYYRLYVFFNLCFPQCIPVRNVSSKYIVSDHPALHKPGLVESKSIQARNVLTTIADSPIRGCELCWGFCAGDFPPALPIPAFQPGAFSHKDVVSEVPFSLLSHSGKENSSAWFSCCLLPTRHLALSCIISETQSFWKSMCQHWIIYSRVKHSWVYG